MTPALTARKLGMIHRIRLVCCASSAFAVLADADELGVDAALCSPALTADGTGASGIAATSPCGAAAVNSKPAFCCAIAGVKANRKIAGLIKNRTKSPVLIKSTPFILRGGQPLPSRPGSANLNSSLGCRSPTLVLHFLLYRIRKLNESPLWPSAIDSSTLDVVPCADKVCKLYLLDEESPDGMRTPSHPPVDNPP